MEYTLRPATPSDLDYCFNLHRATMRDSVEATWGWDDGWQRERFENNFDPDQAMIIQMHGQYAGVLVTEDREDAVYLSLIEVSPSYQNQGLGTAVMNDLQIAAAKANKPIRLHVLKANEAAHRLYEQLGFAIESEEEHRFYMVWVPDKTTGRR